MMTGIVAVTATAATAALAQYANSSAPFAMFATTVARAVMTIRFAFAFRGPLLLVGLL